MNIENFLDAKSRIANIESCIRVMQDYNFHTNTLHVFVEAPDDEEFYKKSIEYVYRDFNILYYPKNGKKYVIGAYNSIEWSRYHKSRILFFVDKDYEDILGLSSNQDINIFVTKYYAIENYISSSDVFRYCLERVFKINDLTTVDLIQLYFEDAYLKFEQQLLLLTSVILIYRRSNNHIELDDIKMDDFFKFKAFSIYTTHYKRSEICQTIRRSGCDGFQKSIIRDKKNLSLLTDCVSDTSLVNFRDLIRNFRQLQGIKDSRVYIRGKYHLWFFCKFYNHVKQNQIMVNQSTNDTFKMNVTIDINESNIFDILPMKINIHNDVLTFLNQNKALL